MEAFLESTKTKANEQLKDEFKQMQLSLPKVTWFGVSQQLYQGFWCPDYFLEGVVAYQKHFVPQDTDVILASLPKTGTTWLKSLIYTIVNRQKIFDDFSRHPFHTKNPHELVCHLELQLFNTIVGNQPSLSEVPSPRLFATHVPYLSLSHSIKASKCRIVYVYRNPLDTFISLWHFYFQFERNKGISPNKEMMEEYLGKFCKGASPFGPYDDHVLGYWNESKENPQKVLLLEYEELKKDPKPHLKSLAKFVGCPFSEEEERGDVIDKIIELCSLKSLKEMEVNKIGRFNPKVENKAYFRTGEVGDWTNHLTPSMVKLFDQMLEKLRNAGFSFTNIQINL